MGTVELLSREGEIAIAKRIEAGREKMIGAICESPMTIRSIINWKESIKEGTMLLRDIVDLEQTYDLSDVGEAKIDDTLKLIEGFKSDNMSKEEKKPKKEITLAAATPTIIQQMIKREKAPEVSEKHASTIIADRHKEKNLKQIQVHFL